MSKFCYVGISYTEQKKHFFLEMSKNPPNFVALFWAHYTVCMIPVPICTPEFPLQVQSAACVGMPYSYYVSASNNKIL